MVFNRESKSNWFCTTTLHTMGLENMRQFFIQPEVKPKQILTRSHTFSRASRQLYVFTTSFNKVVGLSVLCNWPGQSDYFGF